MAIIFCDKCGKIMHMHSTEDNTIVASCECGFSKEVESANTFSEKFERKEVGEGFMTDEVPTKPGFRHICKKCGYEECDIYSIGAPYSDESDIVFYKCRKCKFVERYAQGSSNN